MVLGAPVVQKSLLHRFAGFRKNYVRGTSGTRLADWSATGEHEQCLAHSQNKHIKTHLISEKVAVNHAIFFQNHVKQLAGRRRIFTAPKSLHLSNNTKMDKNQNNPRNQDAGTMLNQKTNEDFNKKKPDPTDPNQQKDLPSAPVPSTGDDDPPPVQGETTDESPIQQNPPNQSEGSE